MTEDALDVHGGAVESIVRDASTPLAIAFSALAHKVPEWNAGAVTIRYTPHGVVAEMAQTIARSQHTDDRSLLPGDVRRSLVDAFCQAGWGFSELSLTNNFLFSCLFIHPVYLAEDQQMIQAMNSMKSFMKFGANR